MSTIQEIFVGNDTDHGVALGYDAPTDSGYIWTYVDDPIRIGTNNVERVRITETGVLNIFGDSLQISTAKTPASASATGVAGTICWDSGFVYVCTATNTWKRAAIATW